MGDLVKRAKELLAAADTVPYEMPAAKANLACLRNAFVDQLAWVYRDQPGDPAWQLTEALKANEAEAG